jgi:hypothetical protein
MLGWAASPVVGAPPVVAETEPNDTPATGNVIDVTTGRALATGSIGVAGDVDYWKITVPTNARIWAFVDTGGPQTDISRDSVLTLFDRNGTTVLETDDDDGTGNGGDLTVESVLASVIAGRQVGTAGTYFLQVRESDTETIGRYALTVVIASTATLEGEPNGSMELATPLVTSASPIAARNAAIADSSDEDFNDDDIDYYSIAATVGDVLFVSADGDPNRDGVQTDVAFDILDATGRLLLEVANHGDGPAGTEAGFIGEGATLTVATNPVYVRVHGTSSLSEGSYRIMAAAHAFPPPSTVFYTVPPCRIADTRTGDPGLMISGFPEWFQVGGRCGIPVTADAAVFNVTVVSPTASGSITMWPGNQPPPATLALAFEAGVMRANNAITGLATDGYADILVEGTLTLGATFDFVIDVTGYFDDV